MKEELLINPTATWCPKCKKQHPAQIIQKVNQVFFEYSCNGKKRSVLISHNAEIFRSLRSKIDIKDYAHPPQERYSWANRINLTQRCNLVCPVCYEEAGTSESRDLTKEDIIKRVEKLQSLERGNLSFFGGEPALHPDILDLTQKISNRGFKIDIQTNGIIFAENPELALQLKKKGLKQIYLQWDSLNPEVITKLRGKDILPQKHKALQSMIQTGLFIGINAVIIPDNVEEVGSLVNHFIQYTPWIKVINFIVAAKEAGRFNIGRDYQLDREHIIESLLRTLRLEGISHEHFFPYPWYEPLRIHIHPDCGALLPLAIVKGKAELLDDYIDMKRLWKCMSRSRVKQTKYFDRASGDRRLLWHIITCIRKGKFHSVWKMIKGYIFKRGDHSILLIAMEQFLTIDYQDIQRLATCSTNMVGPDGDMTACCSHYQPLQ